VEVNGERGASALIQITFCPDRQIPFDIHAMRFHIDDLNIEISETRHEYVPHFLSSSSSGSSLSPLSLLVSLPALTLPFTVQPCLF
jgi:hypothetical protein